MDAIVDKIYTLVDDNDKIQKFVDFGKKIHEISSSKTYNCKTKRFFKEIDEILESCLPSAAVAGKFTRICIKHIVFFFQYFHQVWKKLNEKIEKLDNSAFLLLREELLFTGKLSTLLAKKKNLDAKINEMEKGLL